MISKYRIRTPKAFFVALLAIVALAASSVPRTEEVTITGVVNPVEWDDEDNATAVAITVSSEIEPEEEEEEPETIEEDYYVADNEKGKELLEHIGKTVEATGTVVEDEEGTKTITVIGFKVIEK